MAVMAVGRILSRISGKFCCVAQRLRNSYSGRPMAVVTQFGLDQPETFIGVTEEPRADE